MLKARFGMKAGRETDREDLAVLLACIDDPFAVREDLQETPNDLKRLRTAKSVLPPDESGFVNLVGVARGRRAFQALTLICAS